MPHGSVPLRVGSVGCCWVSFEKAWKESDFIITCGSADPNRLWDGQSWSGRRVLLRCLHGLGDTIQFIRYAPLLRQSCAQLTVQVHPELVSLLEGVSGIDRVCTWGGDTSDWDLEMEVTELPRAFRTIQSTIPSTVPYIQVWEELIRRAETWIEQSRELRVGVVWEASNWDTSRFIPAVELTPILSCKHCQFYSLQKNVDCLSTASLGAIVDLWPRLSDGQGHSGVNPQSRPHRNCRLYGRAPGGRAWKACLDHAPGKG